MLSCHILRVKSIADNWYNYISTIAKLKIYYEFSGEEKNLAEVKIPRTHVCQMREL